MAILANSFKSVNLLTAALRTAPHDLLTVAYVLLLNVACHFSESPC